MGQPFLFIVTTLMSKTKELVINFSIAGKKLQVDEIEIELELKPNVYWKETVPLDPKLRTRKACDELLENAAQGLVLITENTTLEEARSVVGHPFKLNKHISKYPKIAHFMLSEHYLKQLKALQQFNINYGHTNGGDNQRSTRSKANT